MSYIGANKIGGIYLGSATIAKAYLGSTLVYQKSGITPSLPNYLRFTALEDNSSVAFGVGGGTPSERTMSYSKNGGAFLDYTTEDIITINEGEYVEFRRRGSVLTQLNTTYGTTYHQFKLTGKIKVSGKLMSLLDQQVESTTVGSYCFQRLFNNQASIIDAEDLEFPENAADYAFYYMFNYCSGMEVCNKILPAISIGQAAYQFMYRYCSALLKAPQIMGLTVAANGCNNMFHHCSSLVDGGDELPATTISGNTPYAFMYHNCNSLEKAPYIKATTIESAGSFNNMFRGSNKVTSHHFANLAASDLTFNSSNYCTEFIIDAVTPPTIGSSTITGLKSDCVIYVPDESVQAYKDAQYWSARANYIKGISEKPTT